MAAPALAVVLAGMLLAVPPPRPVSTPSPTPTTTRRPQRIARGLMIGGIATAGLGALVLLAVALPGDLRLQRELRRADEAWSFEGQRAHYDSARAGARMRRIGLAVGLPMLVVGTVLAIVAAAARRNLARRSSSDARAR